MDDIDRWPDALQRELSEDAPLKRVFVLRETDSTQDAARRMAASAGDVIVAGRQTQGRGKRGRAWADTESHGIAMTIVLNADRPERLMLATAAAAAVAAEVLLDRSVGIKWPNDIVVDGRKLAGVIVEQTAVAHARSRARRPNHGATAKQGQRAFVGIGMNITQQSWQPGLQDIAVSLAQLGARATRLDAACALLRSLCEVLTWSDATLMEAFGNRNSLRGKSVTLQSGNSVVFGVVREIDPFAGLLVDTGEGKVRLPPETTSIVNV